MSRAIASGPGQPPITGMLPSILDRLIDPESGGSIARPGYAEQQMSRAVQRDLEDLLNTRQIAGEIDPNLKEIHQSILFYGLPDLTTRFAITAAQREEIVRTMEKTIEHHEPRLKNIRVVLTGGFDRKDRVLQFRIEAQLRVDPAPELAFETMLELSTGHYSVKTT